MQGFISKYNLHHVERGDFEMNRQAQTLQARKVYHIPLQHKFISPLKVGVQWEDDDESRKGHGCS